MEAPPLLRVPEPKMAVKEPYPRGVAEGEGLILEEEEVELAEEVEPVEEEEDLMGKGQLRMEEKNLRREWIIKIQMPSL